MSRTPSQFIRLHEKFTDDEFDSIIADTELGQSTITAVREVIMNGKSNDIVVKETGVLGPQLTRGLNRFRGEFQKREIQRGIERETKMLEKLDDRARALYVENKLTKEMDIKDCRNIIGNGVEIVDAVPYADYVGGIVHISPDNIFQLCSKVCIIHSTGRLAKIPALDQIVKISYGQVDKVATVANLQSKKSGIEL